MMEQKITAEWLQAMVGDDDYEPSGLITPNDRAELARRKAARLQDVDQDTPKRVAGDQDEAGAYRLLLAHKKRWQAIQTRNRPA